MLAREAVAQAFGPGSHGTTFGGTPLATAGALAVLQTIERENLVARAAETGAYFLERLAGLAEGHASVVAARGQGLMLGLELRQPAAPVVQACLRRGFVINAVQEHVLRFVPPLIIGREHIDALLACLEDVLP
jgi:acetylornithine aminotransferase